MRPETDEERFEREAIEAACKHEYEEVEMPKDWERMSGVMPCIKCSFGVPISIVRVEEEK